MVGRALLPGAVMAIGALTCLVSCSRDGAGAHDHPGNNQASAEKTFEDLYNGLKECSDSKDLSSWRWKKANCPEYDKIINSGCKNIRLLAEEIYKGDLSLLPAIEEMTGYKICTFPIEHRPTNAWSNDSLCWETITRHLYIHEWPRMMSFIWKRWTVWRKDEEICEIIKNRGDIDSYQVMQDPLPWFKKRHQEHIEVLKRAYERSKTRSEIDTGRIQLLFDEPVPLEARLEQVRLIRFNLKNWTGSDIFMNIKMYFFLVEQDQRIVYGARCGLDNVGEVVFQGESWDQDLIVPLLFTAYETKRIDLLNRYVIWTRLNGSEDESLKFKWAEHIEDGNYELKAYAEMLDEKGNPRSSTSSKNVCRVRTGGYGRRQIQFL